MWCLTKPPPRMIIPVCLAKMACVLMSLRSGEERCGQAVDPASPPPLLPCDPLCLTLDNVQDQAWVLIGMEEDHVTQGAICERWAQHGDVVLEEQQDKSDWSSEPSGSKLVPIPVASPPLCLILGRVLKFSGSQSPQL